MIGTSDGLISSADFASKFLDKNTGTTQSFVAPEDDTDENTEHDVRIFSLKGIKVDTKAIVNNMTMEDDTITWGTGKIDMIAIDAASYNLDADLTVPSLTMTSDVTIKEDFSITGTLDEVDLRVLTGDVIVRGMGVFLPDGRTIIGTSADTLSIAGQKNVHTKPSIANVLTSSDDADVEYPEVQFYPCQEHEIFDTQSLNGDEILRKTEVDTVEACTDICRSMQCRGMTYEKDTKICIIYSHYTSITDNLNAVSKTFFCWLEMKSDATGRYLNVDDDGNLITSVDHVPWLFDGDRLVHYYQGRALAYDVDTDTLKLVDDGSEDSFETAGDSPFKIKIKDDNVYLFEDETDSYKVKSALQQDGSDATQWLAEMDAIRKTFSTYDSVNTIWVPKVFTKSTTQDVSGLVEAGITVFDGQSIVSPNLDTVLASNVKSMYSWDDVDTHEVLSSYTITDSDLSDGITTVIQDLVTSDVDYILLNETNQVSLTGAGKLVCTDVTLSGGAAVEMLIGKPLFHFRDTLAGIDEDPLIFNQMNTFSQASSGVTVNEILSSKVDMSLTDHQYEVPPPHDCNPEEDCFINPETFDIKDIVDNVILTTDTSDVTITGGVTYDQVSITGGALTLNNVFTNNKMNVVQFPAGLITTKDTEIDMTGRKVDAVTFKQATKITGEIFGNSADDFLCVLYKDGNQAITSDVKFQKLLDVSSKKLQTTTLNSFTPADSLAFLASNEKVEAPLKFNQETTLPDVQVGGTVHGQNFGDFVSNVVTKAGTNTVSEAWKIDNLEFKKGVVAVDGVEGKLNGQTITQLQESNDVFSKIHAVKLSAQAEALELCKYISDLQNSYLTNQAVDQYSLMAAERFDGDVMSSSKVIYSQNKIFFFVICHDKKLKPYKVEDDTITYLGHYVYMPDGQVNEINTITTVDDEKYLILTSAGLVEGSVDMFLFDATTELLESVGDMPGQTRVVKLSGHVEDLLLLGHDVADDDTVSYNLKTVSTSDILTCLQDANTQDACISSAGTLVNNNILDTPPPVDKKLNIDAIYDSQGNLLVAFTDFVIAEGAVRVLAFDSDNDLIQNTVTDVEHNSFAFFDIPYSKRVFIVSAGSRIVMDEFDVATGKVTNLFVNCAASQAIKYKSLSIERQLGAQNYVKVIQDDSILLTYEYYGIEGLRSKEPMLVSSLNIDHSVKSVSTLIYSDDSLVSHYLKVMVGGEYVTVLKGILDNPVVKKEFVCPNPEVPASLIEEEEE